LSLVGLASGEISRVPTPLAIWTIDDDMKKGVEQPVIMTSNFSKNR